MGPVEGVFRLLTPNTATLGRWLRMRLPFRTRLWALLDLGDERY